MRDQYLEAIALVERIHRYVLGLVKIELDGLGLHDINNVQAMVLFNIGDAEMTMTELTLRGCYMGTNVSYNAKKLVENGYLEYKRSRHDRRLVHVRLTKKGHELRQKLNQMHERNVGLLEQTGISDANLAAAVVTLRHFERFWMQATDLASRGRQFIAA
jgi:DNA-binding MarR family transcriptional regulator